MFLHVVSKFQKALVQQREFLKWRENIGIATLLHIASMFQKLSHIEECQFNDRLHTPSCRPFCCDP